MFEAIASIIDADISTLAIILNPVELASRLCSIFPATWGALRDLELKVLKHHPGKRCTIDITLQTTTGKHSLIGKVYANLGLLLRLANGLVRLRIATRLTQI